MDVMENSLAVRLVPDDLWARLHRAILDAHGAAGDLDWSSAIVGAASLREKKGQPDCPAALIRLLPKTRYERTG